MSSITVLPQEILENIIDELHTDQETLKICAIVSRSLSQRSRRHLFFNVRIVDATLSHRIHDVLISNTFLSECIHELEISNDYGWIVNDFYLPVTLGLVTSPQTLTINTVNYLPWTTIPQLTRDAFLHILRLPSLINISISRVLDIPLNLFTPKKHLKSLRLHFVSFVDTPDFLTSATTTDSLDILFWTSGALLNQATVDIVTRPGAVLSQVRLLIAHSMNRMASVGLKIMRASAGSLEAIELRNMFDIHTEANGRFEFDFTTLPRLRCLTITAELSCSSPIRLDERNMAILQQLCSFIAANPSSTRVSSLRIVITAHPRAPSIRTWTALPGCLGSSGLWEDMDRILHYGRKGCSSFGSSRLDIVLEMHVGTLVELNAMKVTWGDALHGKMPRTVERGILFCDLKPLNEILH
ncbi:hypothetical protein Hypma_007103 [Hypsizygus marmoreus]|uniref:F-box domain-containing protein n=1 Tax=Hypsizygus marmoreus TaxID=39966 RepID=A0A369KA47_HYPMA|nr:hypothetical protein Hypma_007103 [Hypsizygus marmoreus]